ncbi:MAG: hypothetical protein PHI06_06875 [Desulfobulbaceae bacterium]|nr:hypothetical protein [Desulfobulbaceae bacterium]
MSIDTRDMQRQLTAWLNKKERVVGDVGQARLVNRLQLTRKQKVIAQE